MVNTIEFFSAIGREAGKARVECNKVRLQAEQTNFREALLLEQVPDRHAARKAFDEGFMEVARSVACRIA